MRDTSGTASIVLALSLFGCGTTTVNAIGEGSGGGGATTFPMVFVSGVLEGGHAELVTLRDAGALKA